MSFDLWGSSHFSADGSGSQEQDVKSPSFLQSNSLNTAAVGDGFLILPSSTPCQPHAIPPILPEHGCLFRLAVVDECYQSRFYSAATDFYLVEDRPHSAPYRCLMASCPERNFQDPRAMLRHLKHCPFFPQGECWCPACQKNESFKVVSKRKCSWDKVNIARKLWQKYLKAMQNISGTFGGLHCNCCNCRKSRNRPVGNSEAPPPEYPISPAGLGAPVHQVDQAAVIPQPCEHDAKVYELYESTRKSGYMNDTESPILELPSHRGLPPELSSETLVGSDYSNYISLASNESPASGQFQLPPENLTITMQPFPIMREVSQVSGRGEMPPLRLDTRPSVPNIAPELGSSMLLDEGDTLSPPAAIDSLGTVFTPIVASQSNEILPLNTPYPLDEYLVPHYNTDLHPSPSVSMPSCSNCNLSPSSSSESEPLQCTHADCRFKPHGKTENLRAYLRKHMRNHNHNAIPCKHCDKTFTRQDNRTSHIRKVHPDVDESLSKRRRSSLETLRSASQLRRKESCKDAYGA